MTDLFSVLVNGKCQVASRGAEWEADIERQRCFVLLKLHRWEAISLRPIYLDQAAEGHWEGLSLTRSAGDGMSFSWDSPPCVCIVSIYWRIGDQVFDRSNANWAVLFGSSPLDTSGRLWGKEWYPVSFQLMELWLSGHRYILHLGRFFHIGDDRWSRIFPIVQYARFARYFSCFSSGLYPNRTICGQESHPSSFQYPWVWFEWHSLEPDFIPRQHQYGKCDPILSGYDREFR